MVTLAEFRSWAMGLAGIEEQPHFDMPSFRYKGKIFATYHEKDHKAMLKLPVVQQSVYHEYKNDVFFPVPGSWGAKGATFVMLDKVRKDVFKEALKSAYVGLASAAGGQAQKLRK